MSDKPYDAIVVGARCAGSPTAMLLARQGHRVLVVDKARFPSDTISTHILHPPGTAALRRWGLLDRLEATGCPPIDTYAFDFGPFTISGNPGIAEAPVAYAPRRTVLDMLLVEAAADAGVEVREGFNVDEIVLDEGRVVGIRGRVAGGAPVTERGHVVIGADGRHSLVATAVRAERYNEKPKLLAGYYAYFSNLAMDGRFETYVRPARGFAAWPTNDGLTVVIAGWPFAEMRANRNDVEGNFLRTIELAPQFAQRMRAAHRESRFVGTAVPNYFRRPFGPGWALVGDAGYNLDFITGQGMQDAFLDAELCSVAVHESFSGAAPFDVAMREYQLRRDARVLSMFEFTAQLATLEPPQPEMQQLLGAIHGNQEAMDGFVRVAAGVTSPAEFFSEENVARILEAAAA